MYRFITSITSSLHWSGRQLSTHRTCDAAIPHRRVDPKKTRALKDACTTRIMAALGPTAKTQKQPEQKARGGIKEVGHMDTGGITPPQRGVKDAALSLGEKKR